MNGLISLTHYSKVIIGMILTNLSMILLWVKRIEWRMKILGMIKSGATLILQRQ